jgi:hypothetical protein
MIEMGVSHVYAYYLDYGADIPSIYRQIHTPGPSAQTGFLQGIDVSGDSGNAELVPRSVLLAALSLGRKETRPKWANARRV